VFVGNTVSRNNYILALMIYLMEEVKRQPVFLAPRGNHNVVAYHTSNGFPFEEVSLNSFLERQYIDAQDNDRTVAQILESGRIKQA
jgi:hypothetical protein